MKFTECTCVTFTLSHRCNNISKTCITVATINRRNSVPSVLVRLNKKIKHIHTQRHLMTRHNIGMLWLSDTGPYNFTDAGEVRYTSLTHNLENQVHANTTYLLTQSGVYLWTWRITQFQSWGKFIEKRSTWLFICKHCWAVCFVNIVLCWHYVLVALLYQYRIEKVFNY